MQFNSKAGQELRTWILFFVGIALAIIFALNNNPLNPWWTLVIGAFTCTAIIVSAVQAITGGSIDAGKKIIEDAKRDSDGPKREEDDSASLSIALGLSGHGFVYGFCNRNTDPIW